MAAGHIWACRWRRLSSVAASSAAPPVRDQVFADPHRWTDANWPHERCSRGPFSCDMRSLTRETNDPTLVHDERTRPLDVNFANFLLHFFVCMPIPVCA